MAIPVFKTIQFLDALKKFKIKYSYIFDRIACFNTLYPIVLCRDI